MMRPMKRLFVLLGLCVVFFLSSASAQTADDQYVIIYSLIQQGDGFIESKQPDEALATYIAAETALGKFQKMFPAWNNDVIVFRTKYLATQIADLKSKLAKPTEVITPAAQSASPTASS